MRGRLQILITVICCSCVTGIANAQYRFDQAIRLSDENKLPSKSVRAVRTGKDGFVWIATGEGLCRFDGQSFKMYRHDNNDSQSILDETVNSVLPLNDEVWVATGKGISVLNIKTEKFRHYQLGTIGKTDSLNRDVENDCSVLFTDSDGEIWIGTRTRGVWLYEAKRDNFRFFSFSKEMYPGLFPSLASYYTILSVEVSKDDPSIVWVGTPAGLEEINKKTGEVKWFTFPQKDKDYQVALNAFRRLYYHDDGLLYTGSWKAGVNIFDPVKKTFTPLQVKESHGTGMLNTPISSIIRKSKTEIWITTLNGLVLYNTEKKAISYYKYNNAQKDEYYGIDCVDSLYRVWFTTISGIHYFDPVMQQFPTYSYEDLYGSNWGFSYFIKQEIDENKITVCPMMANGLYIFDRATTTWTRQSFRELKAWNLERLIVRGFQQLPGGDYFISSDEGLFVYKKKEQRLTRFVNPPKTAFNQWRNVLLDQSGQLWIATNEDGLIRRDLKTGEDIVFKKELRHLDEAISLRVAKLYEDSRHNIWFSGSNGFGIYIAAKKKLVSFLFNYQKERTFPDVSDFAEDKKGRVWMSSSDTWIGYANIDAPEQGIVQKINLEEKKINSKAFELATDKTGNVWGYNNRYIFKVTDPDKPFELFSFKYGIKNPDFFHFTFLSSGEMIFGGRNSITIANPAELRRNTELAVPYISELRLLNQPFDPSGYNDTTTLELNHQQNFISLLFSAKAYTMSQDIKFRYRLKGFDDWAETSEGRLANYTNIPPGEYTFQLQAANNEGVWNEKMLELPVYISTPWWQTWWFQITTIAAIAFFTWGLYRYRVSQVRKKEQLRSQYEKKLANVEMSALLAQMNPHFLFNSLNSIDSYIIKNESKKASEYLNNFARLMRLILQNSRSNYISLKDELESLDLYLQMESLRFASRFAYEIKVSPEIDIASVLIPPMLIQPYVENAIWHGLMHKREGKDGKVEILISKKDESLFCVIADNGIGREKAEALRLQKTGNRKRSMGMQITQDRIEMINKLYSTNTTMEIIDQHDEEGHATGTRVELVIPV